MMCVGDLFWIMGCGFDFVCVDFGMGDECGMIEIGVVGIDVVVVGGRFVVIFVIEVGVWCGDLIVVVVLWVDFVIGMVLCMSEVMLVMLLIVINCCCCVVCCLMNM